MPVPPERYVGESPTHLAARRPAPEPEPTAEAPVAPPKPSSTPPPPPPKPGSESDLHRAIDRADHQEVARAASRWNRQRLAAKRGHTDSMRF